MPQELYFKKPISGCFYLILDGLGMARLFGTPTMSGPWWYMGATVVFIAALPFLYNLTKKYGYFAVSAVIIFLPRVFNIGCPGSMNPYTFLPAFLAGMFFADKEVFRKIEKRKNDCGKARLFWQFLADILILLLSFAAYTNMSWGVMWELQFALCPVILIVFCRKYIIRLPGLRKILVMLGKYSMNIFFIHSLLKNKICTDFIYSFKSFWIIPFVLLLISLAISMLVEFIKKAVGYEKSISKLTEKLCGLAEKVAAEK